MAIGDPLSKTTTYGDVEDIVRIQTKTIDDEALSPSLMLKLISLSVQKIARVLNGATAPFYLKTNSTLTLSGTANPYTCDISALNPFLDSIIRVVHVTTGGTRTLVKKLTAEEAERVSSLTAMYASSIFYFHDGDALRFYAGTSFTVTIASDTIELKYYRQPAVGTLSAQTVVYDAAFTISGTTVTNFTGVLAAHVGGTLVGTDAVAALFNRVITKYVSSTSFEISSTVTNAGACTVGYIIPAGAFSVAITRGTYVDILDCYAPLIIDDVRSSVLAYKNNGTIDQGLQAGIDKQLTDIYRAYGASQMTSKQ